MVFVGATNRSLLGLGALGVCSSRPLRATTALSLPFALAPGAVCGGALSSRSVRAYPCLGAVVGGRAKGWIYGDLIDHTTEEVLDTAKARLLLLTDEGDGQPLIVTSTSRTTDAVHIVLGVVGDVVVDDHADIVDVDTSGDDIGRDEQVYVACLELAHDLLALLLR